MSLVQGSTERQLLLAGLLLFTVTVSSTSVGQGMAGWSKKPPPEGWSADAYDPAKEAPGFGDKFSGDENESYDASSDPRHPLKNPDSAPAPGWERQGGARKEDGSPGFAASAVDWDWGERYFEQEFPVVINIKNLCDSTQTVSIFTTQLPFLTLPSKVSVPPSKAGIDVPGKVKLPGPPIPTNNPSEPPMGWVDLDPGYIPPGVPPPKLHQPNFVSIFGEVVVWHPWAKDTGGAECLPARTTYTATGHIHWPPPEPEPGPPEPFGFATVPPCTVWWNTGEEPPQREQDCTRAIQQLAERFVAKVLPSYRTNAPADWEWFESFGRVRDKSITELLAMKARASALMGGPS